MALWQFSLDFLPAAAARIDGVPAIRMSREQLDAVAPELADSDRDQIYDALGGLLPEKAPWSAQLRIWGDEKSDDVQVWFDDDGIESIRARIDASKRSLAFVDGLCRLARAADLVFASEDGAIVRPQTEAVVRAVMQSPAAKLVKDPRAYLDEAVLLDGRAD